MLADGLNKGSVSRDALRSLCERGMWQMNHEFKVFVDSKGDQQDLHLLVVLLQSVLARRTGSQSLETDNPS